MTDIVATVDLPKTKFDPARLALHEQMARAYHGFLHYALVENAGNSALYKCMREFRTKFLSSYFIENAPVAPIFGAAPEILKKYGGAGVRRYLVADYYSHDALEILRTCKPLERRLCFEHVLPKTEIIQSHCEREIAAVSGKFEARHIQDRLDSYWHLAVITANENRELLTGRKMPKGWTPNDSIFNRYETLTRMVDFRLYRSREDAEVCRNVLAATPMADA